MPYVFNPFEMWATYSQAAMMAGSTMVSSATTIANRMMILGTAGLTSDPNAVRREATRMVAEKVYAGIESAAATSREAARLSGRLGSKQAMAMAPATLGMAALKPYAKRAKRNAKRLSTRSWD